MCALRARISKILYIYILFNLKYILIIGDFGRVGRICESYDLNQTRLIVKKNLTTQPNTASWVGSGQFW